MLATFPSTQPGKAHPSNVEVLLQYGSFFIEGSMVGCFKGLSLNRDPSTLDSSTRKLVHGERL